MTPEGKSHDVDDEAAGELRILGLVLPSDVTDLIGRAAECDALDSLVCEALAGRSHAVVLRGEAGIGKSALLRYVRERVEGWHVVRATGVESEMELPFSSLHQLCASMLDRRGGLPSPQRDALETVFGLSSGSPPDPFLVGIATLTLLAEVAERQPLLCIIDDAQWLDRASAQILGFVARRLLAERIALVCASRTGSGDDVLAGLPELHLNRLSEPDARALLLDNLHGPLDAAVCDQLVLESHGNPLALLELARTRSAASLAGGFGLPDGKPLAGKLEARYAQRLARLSGDTQLLILVMAAEPVGDPLLLGRAIEKLGFDVSAARPAVEAGLIRIGARTEFAHPLVRSAAYRAATSGDRRRVHRALADATDGQRDPDRRAWHRARAEPGANEVLADELEQSAGRAQARGGLAAAAAFRTKATELTPDSTKRARRALAAASANVYAGSFDTARGLLTIARQSPVDELHRARIDLLEAQLEHSESIGDKAAPLMLAAARRLERVDVALARQTYLDAYMTASLGARFSQSVGVADVAKAARSAPQPADSARTAADLLLDAYSVLDTDYGAAKPIFRATVQKLVEDEVTREQWRWLWNCTVLGLELWDDTSAQALARRYIQIAREHGALHELGRGLSAATPVAVLCGELGWASSMVTEARDLEVATASRSIVVSPMMLAGWSGQESVLQTLAEAAVREAHLRREGIAIAMSEYSRAVLANGSARYEEAFSAASRASENPREIAINNWGLIELIESAARIGRRDVATDALNRLARKTRASGTDWALGVESRARALVSDGATAEALFRNAIDHLERTLVRAELARAHLLYGEWLRREGRRADARAQLSTAHDMLVDMGAHAFAERTRRELTGTGVKARKRIDETRDDLTAQEHQIAQLARGGLSNPEIGAMLYISPRTVEWHMRKVLAKLGINSRRQLREALPDSQAVATI
jgi:DNA-binding CsgD family transcriptional regulator